MISVSLELIHKSNPNTSHHPATQKVNYNSEIIAVRLFASTAYKSVRMPKFKLECHYDLAIKTDMNLNKKTIYLS